MTRLRYWIGSMNRRLWGEQYGFGVLGVLILVGVVGAIGIIGLFVWQMSGDKAKDKQTGTSNQQSGNTGGTTSWIASDYVSKAGAFTMKYPQSWIVRGSKAGQQVAQLDGTEDTITLQVASDDVKLNNFKGTLKVMPTAPGDETWPLYPNGTVVNEFKNGIGVWRDNQTQILQKGQVENLCPSLRIASEDAFGMKLKNGMYVSFIGSFCTVAGSKTSYSYGQQISSQEFEYVMDMLESIKQQ